MAKNIKEGLEWVKKAAESGNLTPEDFFEIGMIIGRMEKTEQEEKKTA